MRRIVIAVDGRRLTAELNQTRTAEAIWAALPITAAASIWGDEIYFSIGLPLGTEAGQATVALGDLGYWEPGTALCIFYGPTPASRGDEIRPASAVTVCGRLHDDALSLRGTRSGASITISRADGQC